jgi:hypothetical protein
MEAKATQNPYFLSKSRPFCLGILPHWRACNFFDVKIMLLNQLRASRHLPNLCLRWRNSLIFQLG